jgi:hypothetical protein
MEKFPSIDYEDMISDINEDIKEGYITEDSVLYVLRQKTPVFVECIQAEALPVLDFFYDKPVLKEELSSMTVKEAKKVCFDIEAASEDENLKAAIKILIDDMNSYSKGNPKRNTRPCKMILTENDLPMMVYYQDFDPADTLTKIPAGELLSELKACSSPINNK